MQHAEHLALAVALVERLDAEALLEWIDQRIGHRHAARVAHRVARVVGALGRLPQVDVHRAEREDLRRAVVSDAIPERLHREGRIEADGDARHERPVDMSHPRGRVVHRQAAVEHVAVGVAETLRAMGHTVVTARELHRTASIPNDLHLTG